MDIEELNSEASTSERTEQNNVSHLDTLMAGLQLESLDRDSSEGRKIRFFRPQQAQLLQDHPIDIASRGPPNYSLHGRNGHPSFHDLLTNGNKPGLDNDIDAKSLFQLLLAAEYDEYTRTWRDGTVETLAKHTGWQRVPDHDRDMYVFGDYRHLVMNCGFQFNIMNAWRFQGRGKPHVILTLVNGVSGDDGALLPAELLVISAARLKRTDDTYRKWAARPVMVVSIMEDCRARILQTEFIDQKPGISSTALRGYATVQEAELVVADYLLHMASEPQDLTLLAV